jgi:uncharacterized protein (TIGR03086 family)
LDPLSDSFKKICKVGGKVDPVIPFLQLLEPYSEVVAQVPNWTTNTPCAGWTAQDLLDHVVDTQRDFLAQREVTLPDLPTEPTTRWEAHRAFLEGALTEQLMATPFDGYFGPTTIGETLTRFYGFDLLVHRWDLGRATGQVVVFTEAELASITEPADSFGDMLYMEGICAAAVTVPESADAQTQLLARLGRS